MGELRSILFRVKGSANGVRDKYRSIRSEIIRALTLFVTGSQTEK